MSRQHLLTVRMDDAEWVELNRRAEEADMTLSDYVRERTAKPPRVSASPRRPLSSGPAVSGNDELVEVPRPTVRLRAPR